MQRRLSPCTLRKGALPHTRSFPLQRRSCRHNLRIRSHRSGVDVCKRERRFHRSGSGYIITDARKRCRSLRDGRDFARLFARQRDGNGGKLFKKDFILGKFFVAEAVREIFAAIGAMPVIEPAAPFFCIDVRLHFFDILMVEFRDHDVGCIDRRRAGRIRKVRPAAVFALIVCAPAVLRAGRIFRRDFHGLMA